MEKAKPRWFRSKSLVLLVIMAHVTSYSALADDITVQDGSVNNWESFNVNAGEHTSITVVDANGNAMVDGRAIINVLQDYASQIYGNLDIHGIIALLNQNGFDIGANADINVVGGLILSTLGVSQQDFFAGMAALNQASQNPGLINNAGHIHADPGSFIALIAGAIKNTGTIASEGGTAILAAGKEGTLSIGGDGLVNVQITKKVDAEVYDFHGNKIANQIDNSGTITANGGLVKLTAKGAEEVFDNIINHTGLIEAQSISEKNGKIVLEGGTEGVVRVNGIINASGKEAGEKGGTVHVTGEKIGLFDQAQIDASGNAGGGEVLVGGDYQGKNAAMQNALAVYMDQDASIDASAKQTGNGGKVILWSDDSTRAYGTIKAEGGSDSGNGGFIETSGHYLDIADIRVSAAAANGRIGTWLLDPDNVNITNSTSNGSFDGGSPTNIFTPSASSSSVSAALISNILNGTGGQTQANVDITASGNITVNSGVSWNTSNSLTLDAGGSININNGGNFTSSGGGNLTLNAGGGNITWAFGSSATLSISNGGSLILNALNNITNNNTGSMSVTDGGLSITTNSSSTGSIPISLGTMSFSNLHTLSLSLPNYVGTGNGDTSLNTLLGGMLKNDIITGSPYASVSVNAPKYLGSLDFSGAGYPASLILSELTINLGNTAATTPGSLILGNLIDTGDLNLTTGGAISQSNGSALTVSGNTTIDAGSASVTLTNSDNDFGNQTVNLTGGALQIVDSNVPGLVIGNVNGTSFTATAENISQNGAIATTGGAVTINATGDFSQSAEGSITAGSDTTWGDITIHAGTGVGAGTGAVTAAGVLEGNVITIDTGNSSTGDMTFSGVLIAHDTNTLTDSIIITNSGTGDINQTSTGSMTLTYVDARNIGLELNALHGNIQQSGSIDAKQSRVTLSTPEGDHITQDDGAGHLGSITSGSAVIAGQNSETVNLLGNNSLGLLTGSTAGNLTVNDINTNGLALDTVTLDGNLSITAKSISQSGDAADFGIQMTGTGKTANFVVDTGSAVALNHPGNNDFGGNAVSISGASSTRAGAVIINDSNTTAFVFGDILSDSLAMAASGNVSQSGATTINVANTASFDAGTHTTNLGNNNEFGGTITLGHSGITAGAITLYSGSGDLDIARADENADTKFSSLSVNSVGGITQSNSLVVTGTTVLAAQGAISLTDTDNDFNVLQIDHGGNNTSITDINSMELSAVETAGDFAVNVGGTLTLTDVITQDDGVSGKTIALSASQLVNNTGAGAIDLGAGANNVWHIYLENLAGNNFGGLTSGNQAIWGTDYPTAITQTGNRYIFGTPETLTLSPLGVPFEASSVAGAVSYPTPSAGTHYQASGFVNAGDYGGVFTQDTVNNTAISGIRFSSTGTVAGNYPITMTGTGTTPNGYGITYDNTATFGHLTLTAPPVQFQSSIFGQEIARSPEYGSDLISNDEDDSDASSNFQNSSESINDLIDLSGLDALTPASGVIVKPGN